jgi:hypothetical protein
LVKFSTLDILANPLKCYFTNLDGTFRMSLSFKSSFLSLIALASLPLIAQADAGLPLYAVVAATATAAVAGNIYGNSTLDVLSSGINKHQVSLMAGSDTDIETARLAYRLDFNKAQWQSKNFVLSTSVEASVGHWQSPSQYAYRSLDDVGLTPIFKIKTDANSPWYAEVGVGLHYLSNVHIKDYSKSTQFQFGDQFGIGWENNAFRVGYKYMHVSNGNIEIPNPSTDFNMIEVGYRH